MSFALTHGCRSGIVSLWLQDAEINNIGVPYDSRPYKSVARPIYMDAALNQLRAEGFDVRPEDVARLSPLGFEHINMLGRYAFTLPDAVARGELRPLRNPAAHGTNANDTVLT